MEQQVRVSILQAQEQLMQVRVHNKMPPLQKAHKQNAKATHKETGIR